MVRVHFWGDKCFLESEIEITNNDLVKILNNLTDKEIKSLQSEFPFSALVQQGNKSKMSVDVDFAKHPTIVQKIRVNSAILKQAHEAILDHFVMKPTLRVLSQLFNIKVANDEEYIEALEELVDNSSNDVGDCKLQCSNNKID